MGTLPDLQERETSSAWLQAELDRFDPHEDCRKARTPPWTWYSDSRFLALEDTCIFGKSWQAVAHSGQFTQVGDCYASTFLGRPFVIVRGEDHKLRAFYNVCAHHAAEVVTTEQSCQQLVCPYHGWTYDLNGRLTRAPGLGAQDGFDPKQFGLRPIAVAEWGPLVFLHFGETPPDLAAELSPLRARLDAMGFDNLQFVTRREYRLQCNWKVFVDNYLDGGYHVAAVHPGLAGQLNLDDYRTELFDRFSIQSCDANQPNKSSGGEANANGADFAERIGGGSIYAWLYPNLMINRYGPMMDVNWVLPVSPSETLTVFDYYFEPEYIPNGYPQHDSDSAESAQQADFIHRSLVASHQVQVEDVGVCESVQRGLQAGIFSGGRYASMELGEHHFHQLVWNALSAGIASE